MSDTPETQIRLQKQHEVLIFSQWLPKQQVEKGWDTWCYICNFFSYFVIIDRPRNALNIYM